tara:strand:- start:1325 stop:1546 length:222 start_codon:yes stop_codon:yes gene_type:complete
LDLYISAAFIWNIPSHNLNGVTIPKTFSTSFKALFLGRTKCFDACNLFNLATAKFISWASFAYQDEEKSQTSN